MKNLMAMVLGAAMLPMAHAAKLEGQAAKDLYLALKDVREQPAPYYSLLKVFDSVECTQSYQSIRYDEHYDCKIVDATNVAASVELKDIYREGGTRPSLVQGAKDLYAALSSLTTYHDGGNPPPMFRRAKGSCHVKSPTNSPVNDEAPASFTCEIEDLGRP